MKRILNLCVLVPLMFILIIGLTACTTTTIYEDNDKKFCNQFIVVEKQQNVDECVYIVYDIDTKIMYYIFESGYAGGMSPIYNTDGSIKVYDD